MKTAGSATVFFAPRSSPGVLNSALGFLTAKPAAIGETKKCHLYFGSRKEERASKYHPSLNVFINVPASERGSTKRDVLRGVVKAHLMRAGTPEIVEQREVFAKWAFTHERVGLLKREAAFYTNELRDLQGDVVPRFIGLYVNQSEREDDPFAILLLENCKGGVPDSRYLEEYHRQYMLAACKLHDRRVSHNQLAQGYKNRPTTSYIVDRHVFLDCDGKLKIVDFTLATRHQCGGALVQVVGAPTHWTSMPDPNGDEDPYKPKEWCKELSRLEEFIGAKRTGATVIGAVSVLAEQQMAASQAYAHQMYMARYPHYQGALQ